MFDELGVLSPFELCPLIHQVEEFQEGLVHAELVLDGFLLAIDLGSPTVEATLRPRVSGVQVNRALCPVASHFLPCKLHIHLRSRSDLQHGQDRAIRARA